MANVLFTRTSDPNSKPVTDGQLVFDTSGNGKMYLDNGTERLEMGGSMSVDSVLNAESTNPIQNKAVAGVMLKTLDEVGAVTKAGFIPDALTVKQLNSNLDVFSFRINEGTKQVSTDGGKTWENFSSGAELLWENSAPSSGLSTALTLDVSSYSYVYVEALYSNATKESQYTLIDVKNTTSGYISAWKIISGTNWYGACRPYTI